MRLPQKKLLFSLLVILATVLALNIQNRTSPEKIISTGAPPNGEAQAELPPLGDLTWLKDWQRPEGPARVAIQVGHWQRENAPEEQKNLRKNNGASGGGKTEVEVNLAIAQKVKEALEAKGVMVDLLPVTIPPRHWADAFITIHADGNEDLSKRGYKIAASWRDLSGQADKLISTLDQVYGQTSQLPSDPEITQNMRGYYAFSWWKYQHAIHPLTPAAIVETGFLTNELDRQMIVDQPEVTARGITKGLLMFLENQQLLIPAAKE